VVGASVFEPRANADDFSVSIDLVSDLLNLEVKNMKAAHLLIKTARQFQISEIFITRVHKIALFHEIARPQVSDTLSH
jgi:hypothetical protein